MSRTALAAKQNTLLQSRSAGQLDFSPSQKGSNNVSFQYRSSRIEPGDSNQVLSNEILRPY